MRLCSSWCGQILLRENRHDTFSYVTTECYDVQRMLIELEVQNLSEVRESSMRYAILGLIGNLT